MSLNAMAATMKHTRYVGRWSVVMSVGHLMSVCHLPLVIFMVFVLSLVSDAYVSEH